ncbi:hypothetical protein A2159_02080 [Candidatus Woesebacteria bacterium RBG_13_34_9]|uniref:Glycosyl transferase family 1 domain-containing protein n=1 Tax=Candidatus Woesebacteria bacterium RBG_13_34_9 TaxID=1802477 RepID=A0A1F7X3R9_9BACT|nr:MAG: hypothetical protein A2159_02080 [Candidatus Woesebacteria bacterium RBG_13_34_9]
MRAAIYNPYLDTLGGGERYTLVFANVLQKIGYEVYIQWNNDSILERIEQRFGLNTNGIKIVKNIKRGDGYDFCFWISDGSIPLLRARKNILHFQIPFMHVSGRSLINKMKLFRINAVICNSNFTKNIIDSEYGIDSIVIYPPVDIDKIKPKKKRNIILSVGRFSQLTQAKRQDVLVEVFKILLKRGLTGWKLILAGGTEVGADKNFFKLKKAVAGYPIEIIENPKYKDLIKLYSSAKLFWSASGYDINENTDPQKVEHFGITIVEAMSAGAVPLVFNAGGHKEIVKEGLNGYLWSSKSDLLKKTINLINKRNDLIEISQNAVIKSNDFGYERFYEEVSKIIR